MISHFTKRNGCLLQWRVGFEGFIVLLDVVWFVSVVFFGFFVVVDVDVRKLGCVSEVVVEIIGLYLLENLNNVLQITPILLIQ